MSETETKTPATLAESIVSYGDVFKATVGEMPVSTVVVAINRGLAALLGNEVASGVTGSIRQAIISGTERKATDVSTDEVKKYRAEHPAEVKTWHEAETADVLKAMREGTLTARAGGPRGAQDPIKSMALDLIALQMRPFLTKTEGKAPSESTLSKRCLEAYESAEAAWRKAAEKAIAQAEAAGAAMPSPEAAEAALALHGKAKRQAA